MTTKTNQPAIKLNEGEVLRTALKVEPGAGAIKLAQEFAVGRTYEEVAEIMADLIDGYFEGADDKRVKRCHYCGYFYRDVTKNNSSHVCSPECKAGKDVVMQDYRRKVKASDKPKKLTNRDKYYNADHEYPFWISEYEMMKHSWKYELMTNDVEKYEAAKQRKIMIGGKRRGTPEAIDYNGDEHNVKDIHVKFTPNNRDAGKEHVKSVSASDQDAYLLQKYGATKLAQERRRAQMKAHYGNKI